jgi:leucyl-tRNA synthetase/predicted alpha/beta hydrolase family esterase
MNKYNHKKIEAKWQKIWQTKKIFQAKDFAKRPKKFILVEFPYPSGEGLHMGHLRPYVAADVYSRFFRMRGNEVIFPMGWDAFGLPAENYAIKKGIHPSITTKKNISNAKKQMQSWGLSFDWSREINTTDPNYYKWTQWLFLQFFKKGLAYEATGLINWCPKDKTGLANEEVIDGKCERCGTIVEKKELRQWYLKITSYAEKLLEGLKHLPEWPSAVKLQQENWIGKKTGINITYPVENRKEKVTCFTTRPDTNFGATFIVLGPEHPLLANKNILDIDPAVWKQIKDYQEATSKEAEQQRTDESRKKTGVFTGLYCVNALNNYRMPLYVADYVLGNVGTGAVVGVPGHDKRDFEFARVFNIPVVRVVQKDPNDNLPITSLDQVQEDEGVMVNSDFLNGMDIHQATQEIMDRMAVEGWGKRVVTYKLRDWVFSRQRYWGEPIPLIHCDNCAKKPKILVLHGLSGHPSENWFPWFKKEMERKGYEVLIPALSNDRPPKLDEWVKEMSNLGISKKDRLYVVGHSLGARAACHFIAKAGIFVEKFILVAPTGSVQGEKNWENLRKAGITDDFIKAITDFNRVKIPFDKLKRLVKSSLIYLSDNDPYIPMSIVGDYGKLKPRVQIFKAKGHFNKSAGVTELPEILDEFPYSANDGWVPVPDKDLPVKLPNVKKYEPTGTGESPLAAIDKWVNVKCPVCKTSAKRETNTMPQWAGSSWYWLRYTDPKNKKEFASISKQKYWTPVDVYFGGMEHTTLHLLYSRFWNLFLYDQGLVTSREPYSKRKPHGIILGPDGEKMSKSRGNVVNPQDIVASHGADTLRMFELFLGPHEDTIAWNDKSVVGVKRFLDRVWNWINQVDSGQWIVKSDSDKVQRALNKLIKKITEDIEQFHFNTAISAFMEFHNEVKDDSISLESIGTFLKLLYPFAPHISEELIQLVDKMLGRAKSQQSLQTESWPIFDPAKIVEKTVEIVVQVNGKFKGRVTLAAGTGEQQVKDQALAVIGAQNIKRVIFVPNRLINFVI